MGTVFTTAPQSGVPVRLVSQGSGLVIQATLPDGSTLLANRALPQADAAAIGVVDPASGGWIWVTPVSHLVASYLAANPSSDAVSAVQKVKRYLGMGPTVPINRPFAPTYLATFSPDVFFQAAAQAGGLSTFTATTVSGIQSGATRSFAAPDPYARLRSQPSHAALITSKLQPANGARHATRQEFLVTVLGHVVGAAAKQLLGWVAGKCGLNIGTTNKLKEITNDLNMVISQLNAVQGELAALSNDLNLLGTQNLLTTLQAAALTPLNGFTIQEKTATEAATAPNSSYIPFSPASSTQFLTSFTSLLNQTNAFDYANDILVDCLNSLNGGNMIMGFAQAFAASYGSGGAVGSSGAPSQSPSYPVNSFFYNFRSDLAVTQYLQNNTDTYVTYLAAAANMLSESYNAVLASGPTPATSITQGQFILQGAPGTAQVVGGSVGTNGIVPLSKRVLQQRPLALLGGENALPANVWMSPQSFVLQTAQAGLPAGTSLADGTMFATTGIVINEDGSTSSYYVQSTAGGFSIDQLQGWSIPTLAQCQRLAAFAKQAATISGQTGSNAIAYGLVKMGLLPSQYQSLSNVEIYCDFNGSNAMSVYSSTSSSASGNGINGSGSSAVFRPQGSGTPVVVLLVRAFPGPPPGTSNFPSVAGQATQSAPSFVSGSTTYQTVQAANKNLFATQSGLPATPYVLQSSAALAANLPPNQIVTTQDTSNPQQLHAYALWIVNGTSETFINSGPGASLNNLSGFPGYYVLYDEITDVAEWLSSNPAALTVSNFPSQQATVTGATMTGVTLMPGGGISPSSPAAINGADVLIEGAQISGSAISGGTVYASSTATGTVSGGTTTDGAPSSGVVTNASISAGVITSGTVSGGTTLNLISTDGTQTDTITTGVSVSNATISGGVLTVAVPPGLPGVLTVHNSALGATVTASLMTNPSTNQTTNASPSAIAFLSGSMSFAGGAFSSTAFLESLILTPDNFTINLSGPRNQNFYVTGVYSDGSYQDLTPSATFQIYIPSSPGQTVTLGPGNAATFAGSVLQFPATFTYRGNLVVAATAGGAKVIGLINVLPSP